MCLIKSNALWEHGDVIMQQEELIKLLQEKKSIFQHFKLVTEERKYDAPLEDNADSYVSVTVLRGRDLDRVAAIDKKIEDGFGDTPFLEEALRLKEEIKALVQGILANEKFFSARGIEIKNKLQTSIKLMNRTKESTRMYNHDALHLQASRFDTKN